MDGANASGEVCKKGRRVVVSFKPTYKVGERVTVHGKEVTLLSFGGYKQFGLIEVWIAQHDDGVQQSVVHLDSKRCDVGRLLREGRDKVNKEVKEE